MSTKLKIIKVPEQLLDNIPIVDNQLLFVHGPEGGAILLDTVKYVDGETVKERNAYAGIKLAETEWQPSINEQGEWVITSGENVIPLGIKAQGPAGVPGVKGAIGTTGPMPSHEWDVGEGKVRFQNSNGDWGNWQTLKGPKGDQGDKGPQGDKPYLHIRYRDIDESGNAIGSMTSTPGSDPGFIGVAASFAPSAPTAISDYTWLQTEPGVFIPHLDEEGNLLFERKYDPASISSINLNVKGPKGDKGNTPIIKFVYDNSFLIDNPLADYNAIFDDYESMINFFALEENTPQTDKLYLAGNIFYKREVSSFVEIDTAIEQSALEEVEGKTYITFKLKILRGPRGYPYTVYKENDTVFYKNTDPDLPEDPIELFNVSDLKGPHPILRVHEGYIQYKLNNQPDTEYTNLYNLDGAKGPKGDKGDEGPKGDTGRYYNYRGPYNSAYTYYNDNESQDIVRYDEYSHKGLYIYKGAHGTQSSSPSEDPQAWEKMLPIIKGDKGEDGVDGQDGTDGTSVEIKGSYDTEESFETFLDTDPAVNLGDGYIIGLNLYVCTSLTTPLTLENFNDVGQIKGDKGEDGKDGVDGQHGTDGQEVQIRLDNNQIEWKLQNDTTWNMIIHTDNLKGADGTDGTDGTDGEEIEIRKHEGHIEWRLGLGVWNKLIELAELKGDKGDEGPKGDKGEQGDVGPAPTIEEEINLTLSGINTAKSASITKDPETDNYTINITLPKPFEINVEHGEVFINVSSEWEKEE